MTKPISIRSDRLLARFLRYVEIDTTAVPESSSYPSSPGQLELGRLLVAEMKAMGVTDAHQDAHGLVWATLPATSRGDLPTILFNAHLDTSPEAPGANVRPQVIESYAGGDIALPQADTCIRVADAEELLEMHGHCLITSDGNTLLGGDDKAGVAAIMELVQHLIENPRLPHGPVRILFTCDEEIGRGAQHMDLKLAAAVAGYTLDGAGQARVENENFSADQLIVRILGYNIHPALAKNKMLNASRGLAQLLSSLPQEHLTPESTDGKQGFIHPYELHGNVSLAEAKLLLRDFDTHNLDSYAQIIEAAANDLMSRMPGLQVEFERVRQYRNMADWLRSAPHVVDFAVEAHHRLGHSCELGAIRGGTDGAVFSEMGLPTPNLSVGQHNIHSMLEFVSLNEMVAAVQHAVLLLELWQDHARS